RYAMILPGMAMILCGLAYYRWTTDFPEGNISDLGKADLEYKKRKKAEGKGSFAAAVKDRRVWALFIIYGACFGIELTINNVAAIYYHDSFELDLRSAGLIAGLFGLMNLFARSLGGYFGDKAGIKLGLSGRVKFLGFVILMEGLALLLFSQMTLLPLAIGTMIIFSLFVQMAEGATFSVVPFINEKAIGVVSGIVGAGGNAGAVLAGFLFKAEEFSYSEALAILGIGVALASLTSLLIRFSPEDEKTASLESHSFINDKELQIETAD